MKDGVNREVAEKVEPYCKDENETILDCIYAAGLVSSRAEGRRLIKQNAVKWYRKVEENN